MKPGDDSVVVIDCKDEGWDSVLYESLHNRRLVQLKNLHNSYEDYMKQMAQHYSMLFVGYFEENRGEFKRRDAD